MAKEPTLTQPRGTTMYDVEPGLPAPVQRPMLPVDGNVAMQMQSRNRIVTAQKVALPRSEPMVKQRLLQNAAAAGSKYYYSIPYGGKGGGTMVMGPSVKLASDAARMWGNCEIDCQFAGETDTHFIFEGVFIDFETGYVLRRPYLQRKDQDVGIKDRGRSLDQVFQIAASKATRNVICRALPDLVDAAYEAAQRGMVDRVGKDPQKFRDEIRRFLEQEGVPLQRVERLYGKPLDKMNNADLAKLAAQCTAVNDNMIDADECWPPEGAAEAKTEPKQVAPQPTEEKKPAAEPAKKAEPKKAAPKKEAAKPAAAPQEKAEEPSPPDETAPDTAAEEPAEEPAEAEQPEEGSAGGELMFD